MTNNNSVVITPALMEDLNEYLRSHQFSKIAVLTDSNTREHCYPLVSDQLPAHTEISIPAGEDHKNIHTCISLWEKMTSMALDRKALMINLGGGVIGDMGGFAAAAYKRGITFI